MRENVKRIVCISIFFIFASGCAQTIENPTETPTPTATIVPTLTNTPTPSPEPTTTYVYKPPPSAVPQTNDPDLVTEIIITILEENVLTLLDELVSPSGKYVAQKIRYNVLVNDPYYGDYFSTQLVLRLINLETYEVNIIESFIEGWHDSPIIDLVGWGNEGNKLTYLIINRFAGLCLSNYSRKESRFIVFNVDSNAVEHLLDINDWVEISPSMSKVASFSWSEISFTSMERAISNLPKILIYNFDEKLSISLDTVWVETNFESGTLIYYYGLVWSPDETHLAYVISRKKCEDETFQVISSLVLVDIESGTSEILFANIEKDLISIKWDAVNRILLIDKDTHDNYSFSLETQKLYLLDQ